MLKYAIVSVLAKQSTIISDSDKKTPHHMTNGVSRLRQISFTLAITGEATTEP